jgi:hypothetical protein
MAACAPPPEGGGARHKQGEGQDVHVASLADDKGMSGGPARAPISMHPAFPFIVALWFAALLGIGSLVVPVALVEQLSVASGLAAMFPPAAPPLGFTARALMALAFTLGGAMAGLVIARQVAKAHRAEPRSRFAGAAVLRTPISAIDELGNEGLDGRMLSGSGTASGHGRGRRALAIEPEEGPSEFLELAPLPGAVRDTGLSAWIPQSDPVGERFESDLADDSLAALELTDVLEPEDVAGLAPATRAEPVLSHDFGRREPVPGFTTFDDESGYHDMDDRQFFRMPEDDSGADEQQVFDPETLPEPALQPVLPQHPSVAYAWTQDEEVPDDALAFSPPSLARDETATQAFDPASGQVFGTETAVEEEEPDTQWEPQFVNHRQFDDRQEAALIGDEGEGEGRADARQLDDLGLVQLAQRLGSSIERRRQLRAARAAAAVPIAPAPLRVLDEDIDMAAPDEAAEAMAAWFSPSQPATSDATAAETMPVREEVVEEVKVDAEADEQAAGMLHSLAPLAPADGRQVFQPVVPEAGSEAAAYRPLSGFAHIDIDIEDEDDDDQLADLAASFTLPTARTAPVAAPVQVQAQAQADPLASLRNPFHERPQAFVRIEDEPEADHIGEPAVVFPSEAPTVAPQSGYAEFAAQTASARPLNTEEHERALREALLSLQRMSGAA